MAIANYTKKINGMRSIPQSHTIRSSKNYLKTTPERYMTPPDIFDLVLILRALMHHLSGIFGLWIGWGMTKNHPRIVLKERSLKCMLCSKCNGRLLLTFSGQKGSRICRPWGPAERLPKHSRGSRAGRRGSSIMAKILTDLHYISLVRSLFSICIIV